MLLPPLLLPRTNTAVKGSSVASLSLLVLSVLLSFCSVLHHHRGALWGSTMTLLSPSPVDVAHVRWDTHVTQIRCSLAPSGHSHRSLASPPVRRARWEITTTPPAKPYARCARREPFTPQQGQRQLLIASLVRLAIIILHKVLRDACRAQAGHTIR